MSKSAAFQLPVSLYQSSGWGRFIPLLLSDFGGLAAGSETTLGEEGSTCTAALTGSICATGSTFGSAESGSGSGSGSCSGSTSATVGPCASMAVGSSGSCAGVAASNSVKLTPVGALHVASSV
jgi:hypothetical protein